ncbi:MAG: hypothetical protein V2A66_00690 [Pseudomonadota bacterium]
MSTKERGATKDDSMISILPMASSLDREGAKKQLLELQLKMATCSINHEYARIEFSEAADMERRDELLDYMRECHSQYFEARTELSAYDPYELAAFEADLMRQKQIMLGGMQA